MLQEGGLYPGIRTAEVLRLFAAFYDDPADPDDAARPGRPGRPGRGDGPAALGRRSSSACRWRSPSSGRPEVAFLDEPTAGLDVDGRLLVREVVRELRDAGVCVLLTTHDLDEAEKVADRVVIVDHGRVVADGTPAELMAGGGEEIRFGAPAGLDVAALATPLGAPVTEVTPGEYVVAAAPSPKAVAALTAWLAERDLPLADLRAGRQHLEDVFLRLTRRGGDVSGADRATAAGPGRDHALPAAGRVAAADPRHPGRPARLLLARRRAAHRRRGPGRLPGPGRPGPGRHVDGDGQPGHRHRLRAPVPGPQASGRHAARPGPAARRQDPGHRGRARRPDRRADRRGAAPGLGPATSGASPPPCWGWSWPPSPSPASAC